MTDRPIRVLMAIDTLAVGGAERVAVDLSNSLDRATHEVFVCSTRHDGPLRHELASDITVEVLERRARWDPDGLARFVRFARHHEIDLIHTHGRGTMQFVSLARRVGLASMPQVFHDHYGALHVDRSVPPSLRLALHAGVDHYLGVDRRLCRWAVEQAGLPADRVSLAVNGVDVRRFTDVAPVDLRSTFDLPDREVVFVMLAHFRHQKDQPTLYRALAALDPAVRDRLGVVIVGRTPSDTDYADRCAALATSLGVGDQVRVAGARADVPALLAGADAGLLATKNETGPVAVLEYLAAGLPFVASDTGEITRSLRFDDVGFIPEPSDPRALAAALEALVTLGRDGRAAMGARGREVAERRFDQTRLTQSVDATYRGVLGRPPRSLTPRLMRHTAPRPSS
ncbi:MAG: glycosyltransferase [Acidimicrobiales bacterium]|nr:glycosyltransferase [Acidimicrobiales bacterium]